LIHIHFSWHAHNFSVQHSILVSSLNTADTRKIYSQVSRIFWEAHKFYCTSTQFFVMHIKFWTSE
jgi:hypothetical protein